MGSLAFYLLLGGCSMDDTSALLETEEKHYQRGQRMLKEGRNNEALEAFLKVTEKRKDAPESHLEIGQLYLQNLEDPISAIYHFKKYLEYKPNAQQSHIVRQLIETAKKDFIRKLPGQPNYGSDAETLDLMTVLKQLKKENLELKREISSLRTQVPFQQASVPSASQKPIIRYENVPSSQLVASLAPRAYAVESGDTLSSISQKVYGTTNRWQDIYNANRNVLASPHSLRVGQELTVPQ